MHSSLTAIVTSFERPDELEVCLGSLRNQRRSSDRHSKFDIEIIVTDNTVAYFVRKDIERVCNDMWCDYVYTNTTDCYTAAERVIDDAKGDFLCFPSDDNYYVPEFAYRMLKKADEGYDFVYCDMLYDPRPQYRDVYTVHSCSPKLCHIDKGGFIIRKSLFQSLGGFPGKPHNPRSEADGMLAELVVSSGATVGYCKEVLFFHG